MGTLSSSISSLASSTFLDLFKGSARGTGLSAAADLRWSRAFTLLWGVILIGGALLFTDTTNPVVEIGLKIASFTYGGLLGTFFLGLLFPRTRQPDAFAGLLAGLAAMTLVLAFTRIDFTWHTLIGAVVTVDVRHFGALPELVTRTDLLAIVPRMFAESLDRYDVRIWELPDVAPAYEVRMLWHPSANGDAAHAWLRALVKRLFARGGETARRRGQN